MAYGTQFQKKILFRVLFSLLVREKNFNAEVVLEPLQVSFKNQRRPDKRKLRTQIIPLLGLMGAGRKEFQWHWLTR